MNPGNQEIYTPSVSLSQVDSLTNSSQVSISTPDGSLEIARGWVNQHFTQVSIDSRKVRVCKADGCKKQFAACSSHRTFNNHWTKHHCLRDAKKTRYMFHDQLHTNRLVKLVISRHLDYNLVDQPEFKAFIDSLGTNKRIICRTTLSDVINRCRVHLTNLICDKLDLAESVALTFDIWSARKGARGFGCVTAHYINQDDVMDNLILHFKRMKFPHDAETIRRFIEKPIKLFKLEGRVAAITTDNASNNIAAIRMIDESMGLTSLNLGFIHYKCVAHIFDLGMRDAMKDLKDTVKPVRDAVMAIRSSGKRKEKFKDKQRELIVAGRQATEQALELAEDVDHRWNSLFVLLERAFLLREALDYMIDTTQGLETIDTIDWDTIEEVIEFLRPFSQATKLLCSGTDVTISVVSYITPGLIEHCTKHEVGRSEWIAAAAASLKAKLTTYELELYHPVVDIAYFLDPRYKLKYMSEDHTKIVMDKMRDLIDSTPSPANVSRSSAASALLGNDSDSEEQVDELTAYTELRRAKMRTNVFMWWRGNSELYPKLAEIARKVLPIQATSVASERVFSVAGYVDTKSRNRLSDESVENIVLFKSWMKFLNVE